MGGSYAVTVNQMLRGKANSGVAPVPTQTFYAGNFAGTVPPKVGQAQSRTATSVAPGGAFGGVNPTTVAIIVIILVGGGYLLHHMTFETHVSAG